VHPQRWDIHWSGGGFGSFPGDTVGNVMSAQFLEAAQRAIPDIDAALAEGHYAPLLTWLQQNIYQYGKAYSPEELLIRVTGQPLTTEPYLRYLTEKFTDLYAL